MEIVTKIAPREAYALIMFFTSLIFAFVVYESSNLYFYFNAGKTGLIFKNNL
jgi:hypothetical protein